MGTGSSVPGIVEAGLRLRDRRVARIASAAASERGFLRASEEIYDDNSRAFAQRVLNDAWTKARNARPDITIFEFLAEAESRVQQVARRLLGADQFLIETATDVAQYDRHFPEVLDSFRRVMPPADAGPRYTQWVGSTPRLDLSRSELAILPMNAPTKTGLVPTWEIGRARGFRFIASVHLLREFPKAEAGEIARGLRGAELMQHLSPPKGKLVHPYLDRDLHLSAWRWGQVLSTGNAPILASREVAAPKNAAGLAALVSHNRHWAGWELAARLDDPSILKAGEKELSELTVSATRPTSFQRHDFITALSERELVEMALGRGYASRIRAVTAELEHHRAQRAAGLLEALVEKLQLSGTDAGRVRLLTGVVDPQNLHILTPHQHGLQDAWRWHGRSLRANPTRYDLLTNTLTQYDAAGLHTDLPRALNAFLAYEPHHLEPVAEMLQRADVADKVRGDRLLVETYNRLAGMITAAANAHGRPDIRVSPIFAL